MAIGSESSGRAPTTLRFACADTVVHDRCPPILLHAINRDENVRIELTRAEALVLFEFLFREVQPGSATIRPEGSAELNALLRLEGRLEKELWELLSPDYARLLGAAQESLSDEKS
jgi:hypothetical protein